MRWIGPCLLLALTAAVLGLSLVVVFQPKPEPKTRAPIQIHGVEDMSEVTTKWTSANGEHEVTTKRLDEESASDFAARHKEEVLALQTAFPPTGG